MSKLDQPTPLHRLLLIGSCLALCTVSVGCPTGTNSVTPNASPAVTDVKPNNLTMVTISASRLTSPAQLTSPTYSRLRSLFQVMGTAVETPVASAEVIAKPTDGSASVKGTTNAEGKVDLNLDSTKVYEITIDYQIETYEQGQLVKKPAHLESIIKPQKTQDASAPPPIAKVDIASTLVAKAVKEAIKEANNEKPVDLTKIDTGKLEEAINTVKKVVEAKAPELTAMLTTIDTTDSASVKSALRDITLVSDTTTKDSLVAALTTTTTSVTSNTNPGAPPPPVIPVSVTNVTSFAVEPSSITLYRPFPNGVIDPKYQTAVILKAVTTFSDNSTSGLAKWSVPSTPLITSEGGCFAATKFSAGDDKVETITVSAASFVDEGKKASAILSIHPTPKEVRKVTVDGLENLVLYNPSVNNVHGEATTKQLAPTVLYNDQNTDRRVSWSVAPAGAVTIDENGLLSVSSGSLAGAVTVTAQAIDDSAIKASYSLIVKHALPSPVSVTLAGPQNLSLYNPSVNNIHAEVTSQQLDFSVLYTDSSNNKKVIWSVNPAGAATIDSNGVLYVLAGAPAGTVTVTARATDEPTKTASYSFTVVHALPSPKSVTLTGPQNLTLYVPASDSSSGNLNNPTSQQLDFSVLYTDDSTSKRVTWSVSPASAATVDGNGLLKVLAGAQAGTVTVTAQATEDSTKKATFTFTVKRTSAVNVGIN